MPTPLPAQRLPVPQIRFSTLSALQIDCIVLYDCIVYQSELVDPVEEALDYYVKQQEDMEMEKQGEVELPSYETQQITVGGSATGRSYIADKTSSMDALGFAADYKFKVRKIVARPFK